MSVAGVARESVETRGLSAGAEADLREDPDYAALPLLIEQALSPPIAGDRDTPRELWDRIYQRGSRLLSRSNDLWLAFMLSLPEMQLKGTAGLCSALSRISNLVRDHWGDLHPQPDPGEAMPTQRIQALNELAGPQFLRLLRELVIFTVDGKPTLVRDALVAAGVRPAPEGETPFTAADFRERFTAHRVEARHAADELLEHFSAAAVAIDVIEQVVRERCRGGASLLRLDEPRRYLSAVRKLLAIGEREPTPSAITRGTPGQSPGYTDGGGSNLEIRSRAEAIAMLDRVIQFLRETEPSSPVPLVLERGKRLIGRDFLECLEDLGGRGLKEAQIVAGIKASEPG